MSCRFPDDGRVPWSSTDARVGRRSRLVGLGSGRGQTLEVRAVRGSARWVSAVAVLALLAYGYTIANAPGAAASPVSTPITLTDSVGIPDVGTSANARDGNLTTDTYTTPSFNSAFPSYLAFGFSSTSVNRIRLYKDDYVGPHSLSIQYTTDTGSLDSRTWTNVSGLQNGYEGTELLNATSVNSNGTVTGDSHNSGASGWASLRFDTVEATGIQIAFSGDVPCCNHYHVFEFEAHYVTNPAIVVNTTADTVNGSDGFCSLREAITSANTNTASGGVSGECIAGAVSYTDTINLPAGHYNVGSNLFLTSDIEIVGAGETSTVIDGNDAVRPFTVQDASVTMSALTVEDGFAFDYGGAIRTEGATTTLALSHVTVSSSSVAAGAGAGGMTGAIAGTTLDNVTLSANSAPRVGGAMRAFGDVQITDSTITGNSSSGEDGGGLFLDVGGTITGTTVSGNSASGGGGGIYAVDDLTISDSTISGNTAGGIVGGIYGASGTLTVSKSTVNGNSATGIHTGGILTNVALVLENSTVSGNSAVTDGGGITINAGTGSITNSTITNNAASNGGGIYNGGTTTIGGTILANSISGGDCAVNALTSAGFNLVESPGSCFVADGSTDITGVDPVLGSLSDNGGPSLTHALGDTSPAIDAGTNTGPSTDQRGAARPIDGDGNATAITDIGAFEIAPLVYNTGNVGLGSLRSAIMLSNTTPGHDEITFDIPGSAPHTISPCASCPPGTALPTITDEVTIDAYTQEGAAPATDTSLASPGIRLNGDFSTIDGLHITAGNSAVRGFELIRFGLAAIHIESGGGNTVAGNLIGTATSDAGDYYNGQGVFIDNSPSNMVGGPDVADRNIISNNLDDGVEISGSAAGGNTVQGNYIGIDDEGDAITDGVGGFFRQFPLGNDGIGVNINGAGSNTVVENLISDNNNGGVRVGGGANTDNVVKGNLIGTDAAGEVDIGNASDGIRIEGSGERVTVGGTTAGDGNVISGNGGDGVRIVSSEGDDNDVLDNYIGTNAAGDDLGNDDSGVELSIGASDNEIGTAGFGNTIAFNNSDGVTIGDAATGNVVRGNSIHDNGGLGIDLNDDDVTGNDTDDPDPGPNLLQNFPVVDAAGSGSTRIKGTINSDPSSIFFLDFYSSASCDGLGNGEGTTHLGSVQTTTNAAGDATFDVTFTPTSPVGNVVTATASGAGGAGTSEFSACRTVISARDFGDAPDSYDTLLDSGGPSHEATGPKLGSNRDEEPDAETPLDGTGDDTTSSPDDEDGVMLSTMTPGKQASATTVITDGPVYLDGWVDFNADGDFTDDLEQIFQSVTVSIGTVTTSFNVPSDATVGSTYARFRVSTTEALGHGGAASDGEVEDYAVEIVRSGADFNGDGFDDAAFGVPGEDFSDRSNAGVVNVIYGSASGLSATTTPDQLWHLNVGAVAGSASSYDKFGTALAFGDFNGDDFSDLAIGVPGKSSSRGAVSVLYGSSTGLTDVGSQFFQQGTGGVDDTAESSDAFGSALAAGDFDEDGFVDLAVGAPGENSSSGAVNVLRGSASGLTTTGDSFWRQGVAGVPDSSESGDKLGSSLAAGDFDGDGDDDLAAGIPSEDISGRSDVGAALVLYGSASGPTSTGSQFWNQNSTDVEDSNESGDKFGSSLASADFDNDGTDDLAVGVPFEDVNSRSDAGAANVLYGSETGLSAAGDQVWHQDAGIVADAAESSDKLGSALAAGDYDGDGTADLAMGAPGESVSSNSSAGGANVLLGSGDGLTDTGNTFWSQNSSGITDSSQSGDNFAAALSAGDYNGDDSSDLLVGVPKENDDDSDTGASNAIYGGTGGLTATGNQFWHQAVSGVEGSAESGDAFATAVA